MKRFFSKWSHFVLEWLGFDDRLYYETEGHDAKPTMGRHSVKPMSARYNRKRYGQST